MSAPFATACILSFNRLEFIQQMIGTMVAYAGHPLEIIVHDDGTSDPTQRAYLHHLVNQGRISTLIENPPGHNQGQGIALNRMFNMAKGDPIIKLDHDLIFREGWLRHSVDVLKANAEEWHNGFPRIGCLGLFKYEYEPVRFSDMLIADRGDFYEVEDFVGSAMVITRASWEQFGPFGEHSEAFAEDAVFKQNVTASNDWCCALTKDDLCRNQGFGVGPSTLVINEDHDLQPFKREPKIIYPRGVRA